MSRFSIQQWRTSINKGSARSGPDPIFLKRKRLCRLTEVHPDTMVTDLCARAQQFDLNRWFDCPQRSTLSIWALSCPYMSVIQSLQSSPFPPPFLLVGTYTYLCAEDITPYYEYMVGEYLTDTLTLTRPTASMRPLWRAWISRSDQHYLTLMAQTMVRVLCCTRSAHRGVLFPENPGAVLYRYLPLMVQAWDVGEVSSRPFLLGLRAVLQLGRRHTFAHWNQLETAFVENVPLRQTFPQVWDQIQRRHLRSFRVGAEVIAGHLFLYGMLVHLRVSRSLKRLVWTGLRVQGDVRDVHHLPRPATHPWEAVLEQLDHGRTGVFPTDRWAIRPCSGCPEEYVPVYKDLVAPGKQA